MYIKTKRNSLGQFKKSRGRFLHISQSYTAIEGTKPQLFSADFRNIAGRPSGATYRRSID